MPAAASNIQQALAIGTRNLAGSAVAPIWQGMRILRDPYTDSSSSDDSPTSRDAVEFRRDSHSAVRPVEVQASLSMAAIETRFSELRQDADGRLSGTVLKYGDVASVGGISERFESGRVRRRGGAGYRLESPA